MKPSTAPGIAPTRASSDTAPVGAAVGPARVRFIPGPGSPNQTYNPGNGRSQFRYAGFIIDADEGFRVEGKRLSAPTMLRRAPGGPLPIRVRPDPRFASSPSGGAGRISGPGDTNARPPAGFFPPATRYSEPMSGTHPVGIGNAAHA